MITPKNLGVVLHAVKKSLKGKAYVHGLKNPFRVLISTMLSARTRDEVTEQVSNALFSKISTAQDLKAMKTSTLEQIIRPIGFYKTKSKHIKETAEIVAKKGVPNTIDELVKLPGVGRKTANLVVSVAFGKPGMCVDTHVHRVTNRWGLVRTNNPLDTEMELRSKVPQEFWKDLNALLVPFGKERCKPISPLCDSCPLTDLCQRAGVSAHR